jgi:hypothetical protein
MKSSNSHRSHQIFSNSDTEQSASDLRIVHFAKLRDGVTPGRDGAPVVAVEYGAGNYKPRKPEPSETHPGYLIPPWMESETSWLLRERLDVNYDTLAYNALHFGVFPLFDLLADTTPPIAKDSGRFPYGGVHPSAFHEGVTEEVLKHRRAGLSAALIKMGLSADDNPTIKYADTGQELTRAALAAVGRIWARANAKRRQLPKSAPQCLRDAQWWQHPRDFTGLYGVGIAPDEFAPPDPEPVEEW